MDYTFYSEVLLHDAHSKHIRIILAIINGILESYKNGFLNLMRWIQNMQQKIQQSADKKVKFHHDKHFETSDFHIMDWRYYKWNNAALFLEYK